MNSEDDSKNLKKRNQNAANKRALSFNENPLPEKLTNSIYTSNVYKGKLFNFSVECFNNTKRRTTKHWISVK
jgi:hypothetical protein